MHIWFFAATKQFLKDIDQKQQNETQIKNIRNEGGTCCESYTD